MFQKIFGNIFGGGAGPGPRGPGSGGFGGFGGFGQSKEPKSKQGGPLFLDTKVQELSFEDHEMQLKALRAGPGPVVLLLYASGGRSCPEACHRIREAYVNLASHSKQAVAAVQCKRRQGKCAEFADKLPAVLFFAKGNRPEKVLSTGTSLSYSLLQKKVAKADVNDMELTAGDFEGGDPCGGQFCLLLLHRGKGDSVPLEKVSKALKNEPVKVYRVSAEKHPAFARAFEGFVGLLRRPAVRLVLYRPKRRSFQSYEGATDSAESVVDFVQKAISRGSQLPEKLSVLPVIQ